MRASSVYVPRLVVNILHIGSLKVRLYSPRMGTDANPTSRTSGSAIMVMVDCPANLRIPAPEKAHKSSFRNNRVPEGLEFKTDKVIK